jgi:hypothetical protein
MRKLLLLACRAFPREHRARQSDEIVDTAVLAADGSAWRGIREALSLVFAGMRQRLRVESDRPLRDGATLLAGVLAILNLSVVLARIAVVIWPHPPAWPFFAFYDPFVVDWWWIAFAVAATGIVLGLVLGNRRLALGAALANLGIVGYDAIFVATSPGAGHLEAITWWGGPGDYPIGWEWLAPAVVLALSTAAASVRRVSLARMPLALVAALLLVVLSRQVPGGFFFLRWPLVAIVVLAMAFGWVAPRLAAAAIGISLAVAPSVVTYLTEPYHHAFFVTWVAAPGLALGVLLPVAYLTRRRLT